MHRRPAATARSTASSLEVRAGEILAVAGVQGNGQTELVEAITGLRERSSRAGRASTARDVTGAVARPGCSTRGVAHVPEDRQRDGLVGSFPVADNLVLNLAQAAVRPRAAASNRRGMCARTPTSWSSDFDVRTPSVDAPASTLSGGNQQKVIVAREFSHAERLLVAAQPTRGLDVGSIQYIHGRIVGQARRGRGRAARSTELDEVLALADRIAVMYRGRIVGVLDRAEADPRATSAC